MKFTPGPNKRITFGYGHAGPKSEEYIKTVGHPHTGVDYSNGYGSPVISVGYGWVYKIITPEQSPSGWCGVYYLCPDDKYGWVEVCQGHLSRVDVKVGDVVREGQQIGLEGNRGEVYSGGMLITKEMQMNGDKRGSHVHEQYRPVRRVKKAIRGKHYLNGVSSHGYTNSQGRYRDKQGMYYEIQIDNDTRGCVDPFEFVGQKNSIPTYIVNAILSKFKIFTIK
jgi:murein DD-endopeptidase MepM/ murein hydrolase activator NlpD